MRRQTFGQHGRRGTAIAASAAVLCLGGFLTGCGDRAGGDGYTAVGAAATGPAKAPSGAVAPTGEVTLVPLDGSGRPRGSGAGASEGASPPASPAPRTRRPAVRTVVRAVREPPVARRVPGRPEALRAPRADRVAPERAARRRTGPAADPARPAGPRGRRVPRAPPAPRPRPRPAPRLPPGPPSSRPARLCARQRTNGGARRSPSSSATPGLTRAVGDRHLHHARHRRAGDRLGGPGIDSAAARAHRRGSGAEDDVHRVRGRLAGTPGHACRDPGRHRRLEVTGDCAMTGGPVSRARARRPRPAR